MIAIVVDTNILSIFAEIDQLDLLTTIFKKHKLVIVPAVYQEISIGVKRGHKHLQLALNLIDQDKFVEIVSSSLDEKEHLAALPSTFGLGEAESIIICQTRGWTFASFDRKAVNFCRQNGITVVTLNDILAAAWKGDFTTKQKIQEIIQQIEATGRTLRAKEEILK